MSPLVEPEVEMAKVVREAYERVVANVIKDQGQDWLPASPAYRSGSGPRHPKRPGCRGFQTIRRSRAFGKRRQQ